MSNFILKLIFQGGLPSKDDIAAVTRPALLPLVTRLIVEMQSPSYKVTINQCAE